MQTMAPSRRKDIDSENSDMHSNSATENPAVANSEDSKDSSGLKDDVSVKVPVSIQSATKFTILHV